MPHQELLKFTPVISLALCGSGIYGLVSPRTASRNLFGILDVGPKELKFYQPMAGRNLGMGIAVGLFTYWRDTWAVGTLILCLLCNGLSDTYIMLKETGPTKNTWLHVLNTAIASVVGSGLVGWW